MVDLRGVVKATMVGVEVFHTNEDVFIWEFDDWFEVNGAGKVMRMRHGKDEQGRNRETFMFSDPDVAFWFRMSFGGN